METSVPFSTVDQGLSWVAGSHTGPSARIGAVRSPDPQPANSWLHVCHSQLHQQVMAKAVRYGSSRAPVLIMGEYGTGKLHLARYIHACGSAAHPIVHVRCANLTSGSPEPDGQWQRLFARFQQEPNATWVLDRIDEVPVAHQPRLSEFVDHILSAPDGGRVISTAHEGIAHATEEGSFRDEVFYQLSVLELRIPPLRKRTDDLAPLVEHFSSALRCDTAAAPVQFSESAIAQMSEYLWPGNVVELSNVVARVNTLAESRTIDAKELLVCWQVPSWDQHNDLTNLTLEEAETRLILKAIDRCEGNKTAAAEQLGVTVRTLHNKMHKYRAMGIVE